MRVPANDLKVKFLKVFHFSRLKNFAVSIV